MDDAEVFYMFTYLIYTPGQVWRWVYIPEGFLVAQLERIRLQCRRPGFDPWVGEIPWRREKLPAPVLWPGELHGLAKSRTWCMCESQATFTRTSMKPTIRDIHVSFSCQSFLPPSLFIYFFVISMLKVRLTLREFLRTRYSITKYGHYGVQQIFTLPDRNWAPLSVYSVSAFAVILYC